MVTLRRLLISDETHRDLASALVELEILLILNNNPIVEVRKLLSVINNAEMVTEIHGQLECQNE